MTYLSLCSGCGNSFDACECREIAAKKERQRVLSIEQEAMRLKAALDAAIAELDELRPV